MHKLKLKTLLSLMLVVWIVTDATGCALLDQPETAYETCRVAARAKFHAEAEHCSDEACIDALSERELVELRECR